MGFDKTIQSGEMIPRRGATDPGKGVRSTRRNYAPDNRKIPPGPQIQITLLDALEEDVDAQRLADGVEFGVEQNTLWHPDGSNVGGLIIHFTTPEWWGPATAYDIYAADTVLAATCFIRVGRIVAGQHDKGDTYPVNHPFLLDGRTYDIALVPVNADGAGIDPASAPQHRVIMDGSTSQPPPDVAGFDVTGFCCDILATWTPVSGDNKNVSHYEIRQGATFDTGAFVANSWGYDVGNLLINAESVPDPTFAGVNDEFHVKAVNGLGVVSDTEDSHTLTAVEIASILAPCCPKARELTPGGGLDTFLVTSLTPSTVQPIVNVGLGAPGAGPGPGIPFYVDPSSFTPNGLLWDYTVHFGMTTVGGEVFPLTETT